MYPKSSTEEPRPAAPRDPLEEGLCAELTWLRAEPLPEAVERRARHLLLDAIGCALSGRLHVEVARLEATLRRLSPGEVRIAGFTDGLSLEAAVRCFACAQCWDEANDGFAPAHGRPALHAAPVALCLGLRLGASLGATLRALVLGYEIGARAGMALRVPEGTHVDGTWGSLGAAAAAAALLDLDDGDTAAALRAAACHIPHSLTLPIRAGGTVRNLFGGAGAVHGLSAALAVSAGLTAPPGALEELGQRVLRRVPAPPWDARWLVLDGYLKPFGGARHLHYAAAAALELRRRHPGLRPSRARLVTYPEALFYCGNRAPRTALQAQFSLSHAAAWALLRGPLLPAAFSPAGLADPEVVALEAALELQAAEETQRHARLEVHFADRRDEVTVYAAPGDPGAPLSDEEIAEKFQQQAAPRLGATGAARIGEALLAGSAATALDHVLGHVPGQVPGHG